MKIMKFSRETIIGGSLAGVISSIAFTYFLDPMVTVIGRFTSFLTQQLYKGYLDSVYLRVARGDVDYAFIVVYAILWFGVCYSYTTSRRMFKKIDRLIEEEKNKEAGIASSISNEELITLDEAIRRIKFIKIIRIAIVLTLLLTAIQIIGDGLVRSSIARVYKQQMIIIAPHITDQKYKELQAMFASMKSQQDYFKLRQELTDIACSKNIQLPLNILDSKSK